MKKEWLPLVILAAAYASFFFTALYHQARALEAARSARSRHVPVMIEMRHLCRCVSFSMPLLDAATNECMKRGLEILAGLKAAGRGELARTAGSALFGAVESSFWESGALHEARRRLKGYAAPPGAHPLAERAVMPSEPWAYFGVMAGGFFFLLLIWFFGAMIMTGRRLPERWKAWAAAEGVLLALYILCMLRA